MRGFFVISNLDLILIAKNNKKPYTNKYIMNIRKKASILALTIIIIIVCVFFVVQSKINISNTYKKPSAIVKDDAIFSTKYIKSLYKSYNEKDSIMLIEINKEDYNVYLTQETKFMLVYVKAGPPNNIKEDVVSRDTLINDLKLYDTIDVNCKIVDTKCEAKTVTKLYID